jgi:hypothetical protein
MLLSITYVNCMDLYILFIQRAASLSHPPALRAARLLHTLPISQSPTSMMAIPDAIAPFIAATVAGSLALLVLYRRSRHSLPLPPGPRPLPLIGNLLDMPKEKDWLTYREWNDQYGDVVYINALGQKIVILGSAQAVSDLLEHRGTIYSDRPTTPMGEL